MSVRHERARQQGEAHRVKNSKAARYEVSVHEGPAVGEQLLADGRPYGVVEEQHAAREQLRCRCREHREAPALAKLEASLCTRSPLSTWLCSQDDVAG